MTANGTIDFVVEDLSGQVRRRARGVPREATVGDLVSGLTRELRLPANDLQGRPLTYGAPCSWCKPGRERPDWRCGRK